MCRPMCTGPLAISKAATLKVLPERMKPSMTMAVPDRTTVAYFSGRTRMAASHRYGVRATGRRAYRRARWAVRRRVPSTAESFTADQPCWGGS
jgi:hypothetical protein